MIQRAAYPVQPILSLPSVALDISESIYRLSTGEQIGELLLRGRWVNEQTFVIEYPYPIFGEAGLGELGETEFRFKFTGDKLNVKVEQLVFGDDPILMEGSR